MMISILATGGILGALAVSLALAAGACTSTPARPAATSDAAAGTGGAVGGHAAGVADAGASGGAASGPAGHGAGGMIMAAGGATGGRAGSGAAGAAGSASPPDAGSGSPGDAGVATLTHPGGWQTQADLTRVRAKVAANQTPWITAWNAIKSADATSTYTSHATVNITNAYTIQQDGHAAYVLAIKWAVTGDAAYAKAAMALIDSWTSTVQSVVNEPLRNGLGSAQMANAAEILAFAFDGAAGWPAANAARARKWFVDVVYLPHTKGGASANWGTSAMIGNISMAVFADDVTMFNDAVSTYKHGFQPLSGGCCGVTQYIDATGEDAESGRDQGHSQGGIGHLLEVAQIAWNQGIDLVTYNDNYGLRTYGVTGANRLLLGLEYTAAYNLGNTVPYHPFFEYCNNVTIYPNGISATGRATFGSQFWEMASSLFTSVGVPHPYSAQILDYAGYVPEATSEDHPGLGTLLFRK